MMPKEQLKAMQTPLVDLLKAIPADARMTYEHHPTSHHMIPVGRLAAEAVVNINWLRAEVDRLTADGQELVDSLLRQLTESVAEQDRLTAENERLEKQMAVYSTSVPHAHIIRLEAENERLREFHQKVAELDPSKDSEEGFNEWGEADCFNKAQALSREALEQKKPERIDLSGDKASETSFVPVRGVLYPGQRVLYVPYHAHGDAKHEDCERGVVTRDKGEFVFVRYEGKSGSQATKRDQLRSL